MDEAQAAEAIIANVCSRLRETHRLRADA